MKQKNVHLQRHIMKTDTQQELRNSRIHPKTRKKLNSKLGGLSKGLRIKPTEE
jgi:hypothetical protein